MPSFPLLPLLSLYLPRSFLGYQKASTIRRQMTLTAASRGARKVVTYSYRPRHCEIIQAEARGSAVTIA